MGEPFSVSPVIGGWKPLALARMIEARALSEQAPRLGGAATEILLAAVTAQVNKPAAGGGIVEEALVGQWIDVFSALKELIFVGLCDPASAVPASALVQSFLFNSPLREAVLQEAKLSAAMRLLYSASSSSASAADAEAAAFCQGVFEAMIGDIAAQGYPFDGMAQRLLVSFSKSAAPVFDKSPTLQRLLREVSAAAERK